MVIQMYLGKRVWDETQRNTSVSLNKIPAKEIVAKTDLYFGILTCTV